jgi:cobalt/nickel transport system permease protein
LLLEFARTEQLPEGAWLLFVWKEWGLYATRGSLELAGKLFLRTLSSVSCLFFILLTIPFAELLQVLRRLGLPAVLTELLLLVYRFIFVVLNTASQLWIAQKSRGGHSGFRNTIRDMGILVGQLFVRTMQRYRQMHDGMAARGFTEDFQVVSTRTYVRSRRFEREAVVGCALLAVLEWWTGG